jgi:hypothetical protein
MVSTIRHPPLASPTPDEAVTGGGRAPPRRPPNPEAAQFDRVHEPEITFDCPTDDAEAACAPAPERYWFVTKESTWHDVRVTYQATARLRARLSESDLAQLVR